jgi:enoyl-CoA hydratase/carnithine racemase
MSDTVIVDDKTPRVRVISLNRPERMNALDGLTLQALNTAIGEGCDPERDIRVIVIRGMGRAFCAGNDLKWLASGVLADVAAHMRHQDLMQSTFELMETSKPVTIAAVNGYAVAGGFELALACDIIVVDEEAELGDAHIRRNMLPSGGGSQRLPRKLGLARAMFYLLTGRRMKGREAERIGLASLAVPGDELMSVALALAEEIARSDAAALGSMKLTARRGMEMPLKEGLTFERWMQFRYRNESPSMIAAVHDFATRGKDGTAGPD